MSHPLHVNLHVSGRAKSHSFMYFRMCAKALVRYRTLIEELKAINELDPRYDLVLQLVEEAAVAPVVYAGMCLESTLYDLSACLFGDEFVTSTEKLDPLGKFFNLVMLVDRQAPDISSVTYQSIQALVAARNKLIHHKSQALDLDEDNILKLMERAEKEHQRHIQGITSSFRALILLSLYFDGNVFEELRIIPSFKKSEYWESIVPPELHKDVVWCIQASKEERARNDA